MTYSGSSSKNRKFSPIGESPIFHTVLAKGEKQTGGKEHDLTADRVLWIDVMEHHIQQHEEQPIVF